MYDFMWDRTTNQMQDDYSWRTLLVKDPNFLHCGISAKIAEMRYNVENNILNKNEQNHA